MILNPFISWSLKKNISSPLALEKISAALCNTAGYLEKPLDIHQYLIQNELTTFAVIVASMLNAGISIDDTLIIDPSLIAKNQDIVVAMSAASTSLI